MEISTQIILLIFYNNLHDYRELYYKHPCVIGHVKITVKFAVQQTLEENRVKSTIGKHCKKDYNV